MTTTILIWLYLTLFLSFKFDVISYMTKLPTEFKLEQYIDYETQFEKTFLDPMRFILQAIGWKHEPTASLEAFFG